MPAAVHKIGVVLLRSSPSGWRVLLVHPIPRRDGAAPPVLPRESRQYRDARGEWCDARDSETAQAHAHRLEPLREAMARAAYEEAGMRREDVGKTIVQELGERIYQSPNKPKESYPVYWFILLPTEEAIGRMQNPPEDTLGAEWVPVGELPHALSAGYRAVIEEAVKLL